MFVVFRIHYTHSITKERLSQSYYFTFAGVSKDGSYKRSLNNATWDQGLAIERYLEQRDLDSKKGDPPE